VGCRGGARRPLVELGKDIVERPRLADVQVLLGLTGRRHELRGVGEHDVLEVALGAP
jgi:hypothetical protein